MEMKITGTSEKIKDLPQTKISVEQVKGNTKDFVKQYHKCLNTVRENRHTNGTKVLG